VAEIKLDGGEAKQRSMLVPILLAILVLAAGGAWFAKVYLHPEVTGSVDKVALFPVHSVFKRPAGTVVGEDQMEDALYVIANVNLKDHTEVPLFIKSLDGTFTTDDGLEVHASAIEKADLPRLAAMFPKMKAAVDAAGSAPLLRESSIPTGGSGSGYVIFVYNVPQPIWEKRKAATVKIDFYHQDPVTLQIPK
jgi:hypothetical protein